MTMGLATGLFAAAPCAQAATIKVTYTGTILDGWDTGVFGMPTQGLSGTFNLVFTGDTEAGFVYSDLTSSYNRGGSAYGLASVTTAVLTIDSTSFTFNGAYQSSNNATADGRYSAISSASADYGFVEGRELPSYVQAWAQEWLEANAFPSTLTTPFDVGLGNIIMSGVFRAVDYNTGQVASGHLAPTRVSLEVSAVPLPGALPLFGSALGVAGLLAYRRKHQKNGPSS
jgi:hypothetical protein